MDRLDQLFARSEREIEAHADELGEHRDRPLLHRRSRTAARRTAAVGTEPGPNRSRGSRHPRARRHRRAAPRGPGPASVAHARWTDRRLGRRRDHQQVLRRTDGRRRLRPSGVVTRPTVRSSTGSLSCRIPCSPRSSPPCCDAATALGRLTSWGERRQRRPTISRTSTNRRAAQLIRHPADGGPRSAERPNRHQVLHSAQGVPGRLVGNRYRRAERPGHGCLEHPRAPTNQVNCPPARRRS